MLIGCLGEWADTSGFSISHIAYSFYMAFSIIKILLFWTVRGKWTIAKGNF